MHFKAFLKEQIKNNKYTFSFSELDRYGIPPLSQEEIDDYTKKEYIQPLLKDFSLIIPPERKGFMQIPFIKFIEDFAVFANNNKKSYYVSYFTASDYHGASHQTVSTYFLNLKNASRSLNEENIKYTDYQESKDHDCFCNEKGAYRFKIYTEHTFPPKHKIKIPPKTEPNFSTDSGYIGLKGIVPKYPVYLTDRKNIWRKESVETGHGFNFSTPSLTAVDLIHKSRHGGMNSILSNIEELSSEMTVEDIEELISWYPHQCALQKLGFLLELFVPERKVLHQRIKDFFLKTGIPRVLLSKDSNSGGSNYVDRRKNENMKRVALKWNIHVTFILDSDLDPFSYTSPDKVEFYAY